VKGEGSLEERGMSKEAVDRFLKMLQEDRALLAEVLGKGTERTDRIAAMVRTGADRGLQFTAADVTNAFAEVGLAERSGELSDRELGRVAGGTGWANLVTRIWTAIGSGDGRTHIGETEKNLSPAGLDPDLRR
jgi:hypothetical protein